MLVLNDMLKKYADGFPRLDPIDDMGITDDEELQEAVRKTEELEKKLVNNPGVKLGES